MKKIVEGFSKIVLSKRTDTILALIIIVLMGLKIHFQNNDIEKYKSQIKLTEQINSKPEKIDGGLKRPVIDQNINEVIKYETDDKLVKELQAQLKKYKNELKNKGSVTITDNTISHDTVYKGDTVYDYKNHMDTISNPYIFTAFGRINDSVNFKLKLNNRQTTVISEEKKGLFGKRTLMVKSTNSNPYLTMDDIVSYQKYDVKTPKIGVGVTLGYGIDEELKPKPMIVFGISYNLFHF